MTTFTDRLQDMWEGLVRRLKDRPSVAPVVRLEGMIAPGGRPGRSLSLETCERALDKAFGVRRAKLVAIVINSPGGSPVQSRMIHDRIRALAAQKGKKVLVFCEDVAASGGYMIACAGDEIIVDNGSILGSIGVVSASFGFTEAMAKFGVERRLRTAGESKSLGDPFSPETEREKARLDRILTAIHEDFVALVKARRGAKLAADPDIFAGELYVGAAAIKAGLADTIGEARAVLRQRLGEKVRLIPIAPPKPGLLARLTGAAADSVADTIESRAAWNRFGL